MQNKKILLIVYAKCIKNQVKIQLFRRDPMNKKITVYYAKDADEVARVLAVLQANGIEAEEKSLGEHVYHDIYGGNGAYGREIQVEEEKEEQARAAINAWRAGKETAEKSQNLSGKILIAAAGLLVIVLLFLR